MRIDTIRLKNFRPYQGTHSYDFTTPAKSNLIIIFGENMTGKTALFTAIRWCLYGRAFDRQEAEIPIFLAEGGEQLLNTVAASAGDFNMEVGLDFIHRGQAYEMRRVANGAEGSSGDVTFENDVFLKIAGDRIADAEIPVRIGHVLHEDVARFSLFDGEMLNDYEKLLKDSHTESDAIKSAIEKTLGLPALTKGAECLDDVAAESERELNRYIKKEAKHQEALKKRDKLASDLASKKRELRTLETSAARIGDQLVEAKKDLGEQREFERLTAQKNSVESQIDGAKRRRQEHLETIRATLEQDWWVALGAPIKKQIAECDQSIDRESNRLQDEYMGDLLSRTLEDGSCVVCHQDVVGETAQVVRDRLALRENQTNTDKGLLSRLHEQRKYLGNLRLDRSAERLVSANRELLSLDTEIFTKEEEYTKLSSELTKFTKGDGQKKAQRYAELESRSRELDKHIEDAKVSIRRLSEEIDEQQKVINRYVGTGHATRRKADLARLSEKAFRRAITGFRESARQRVGEEADAIFKRLTTQPKYQGLTINSNYGLVIRDSNGNPLPGASAGAEHIVALSLIGGLNRAAASGEAPLVMDTNFGRLDKSHRKNVLKYVESLDQQVILLVHSGEIDSEDLQSFDVRCGRRYRIERKSEWESHLEADHA